ncbi:MAG: hypothetical protein EBU90_23465, partial [Proteobacteria bacterium]|nr:hypothetical protein [Pseudomonadota bacterium]
MAIYAALNSGNFTSPTTWLSVDNGSYIDTFVNQRTLGAGIAQGNTSFSLPSCTLSAVGIKIGVSGATPGSILIGLSSTTLGNIATTVIPSSAFQTNIPAPYGWVVAYFNTPVQITASNSYYLYISSVLNTTLTVYTTANGVNSWSRFFVLTSSAVTKPVSGDILYVAGNASSSGQTFPVVTMDNNDQNTYDLQVCENGTVSFSANGNTYLRLNGTSTNYSSTIWTGGTLNIGTIGSPILSSNTAVLEFAPTLATNVGLNIYGSLNTY